MDTIKITVDDFQSVCRICMCDTRNAISFNINNSSISDNTVHDVLSKCACVQVSKLWYTINHKLFIKFIYLVWITSTALKGTDIRNKQTSTIQNSTYFPSLTNLILKHAAYYTTLNSRILLNLTFSLIYIMQGHILPDFYVDIKEIFLDMKIPTLKLSTKYHYMKWISFVWLHNRTS